MYCTCSFCICVKKKLKACPSDNGDHEAVKKKTTNHKLLMLCSKELTNMTTTTYFDLLPEELVEKIYKTSHELYMQDLIKEIHEVKHEQHYEASCLINYLQNLRESDSPLQTIQDVFTLIMHLYLDKVISPNEITGYMRDTIQALVRLLRDPSVYSTVDMFDMFNSTYEGVMTSNQSLKQVLDSHQQNITEALIANECANEWVRMNVN